MKVIWRSCQGKDRKYNSDYGVFCNYSNCYVLLPNMEAVVLNSDWPSEKHESESGNGCSNKQAIASAIACFNIT